MQTETINVSELVTDPANTRAHDKRNLEAITASLERFGQQKPIVVGAGNVVVAGNGTLAAAVALGWDSVQAVRTTLEDQEAVLYAIADNRTAELASWNAPQLQLNLMDLDLDDNALSAIGWTEQELEALWGTPEQDDSPQSGSLVDRFGAPPFTVLDTRQGYWQDRKRQWWATGLRAMDGREHLGSTYNTAEGKYDYFSGRGGVNGAAGGSAFDPVLAELSYKWFMPAGGHVLDPFAGEAVKGAVAGLLGYQYTGIEVRGEQVAANQQQWLKVTDQGNPLESFERVRAGDTAGPWQAYLQAWAESGRAPRASLASCWLTAARSHWWAVIDGCLCIIKRQKVHHTYMLELVVPPIARDGSAELERATLDNLMGLGMSVQLSEEDLARLGFEEAGELLGHELLCSTEGWHQLRGKRWERWRYVDKIAAAAERQEIGPKGQLVVQTWEGAADDHKAAAIKRCMATAEHAHAYQLTVDDQAVAVSMVQDLCPGLACALVRVADYEASSQLLKGRAGQCVQLLDMQGLVERMPSSAVLNLGLAEHRGEGVANHKRLLRTTQLAIYRHRPAEPVSPDTWRAWRPGQSMAAGAAAAPLWLEGDSTKLGELLPAGQLYDGCLTSPPYYDLEVYSSKAADGSAKATYEEFMAWYRVIFSQVVDRLKDGAFVVVKVGDVRDPAGGLRGFVADNVLMFRELGLVFYNDAILVTPAGRAPMSASMHFRAGRKLQRVHQAVLVFFKGNPKQVRQAMGELPDQFVDEDDEQWTG
jgi:DNA modification methylase